MLNFRIRQHQFNICKNVQRLEEVKTSLEAEPYHIKISGYTTTSQSPLIGDFLVKSRLSVQTLGDFDDMSIVYYVCF
jgi:hypothetical protein